MARKSSSVKVDTSYARVSRDVDDWMRKRIQFRTGEPLSYGSNWKLPRTQERVPRSIPAPSYPKSKARMALGFSAKRFTFLQVRRKALVEAPRTRKVGRVFRFRSPFAHQYAQMKFVGHAIRFPKKTLLCVSRKIRRQVLFAYRKAGFSGSARKRHWNRSGNSVFSC